MEDLQLAKDVFVDGKWSLVIVKDNVVLITLNEHRLVPLVRALNYLGDNSVGVTVADKVIGRAAAMLLIPYKINQLYTPLISSGAWDLLNTANIKCEAEEVVPQILDQSGMDLCPMEKLVSNVTDPLIGKERLVKFFSERNINI